MKSFNGIALLRYWSMALAFAALFAAGTVRAEHDGDDVVHDDEVTVDDGIIDDGSDGSGEEVWLEIGGDGTDSEGVTDDGVVGTGEEEVIYDDDVVGTGEEEVIYDDDQIIYMTGGVEGEEGVDESMENLEDSVTPDPEWVQRSDEVMEVTGENDMEVLMSTTGVSGGEASFADGAADSASLDLNAQGEGLSGIDSGADSAGARIEGGRLVVGGRRAAR